jgi:hypothetical protein
MKRVFLGGTCANTTWRDELIPLLKENNIDYFNPVVKDWTPECQAIEEEEKNNKCNSHLYVITREMLGTYSIAEAVHSAHLTNFTDTPVNECIFCVLNEKGKEWKDYEIKSFNAIMKLIRNISFRNSVACYVNNMNDVLEKLL